MTDIKVYGTNKLTGVGIRMKVTNVEKFDPEIQEVFRRLAKVPEYPRQSKMDEYEGAEE